MQLVLDTKNLSLLKKRKSFLISPEKGDSKTISPNKVTSIAITENVLLSSDAVRLAIQHQIPILFFDRIGKAQARLWSPYFESIATLRRLQARFTEKPAATDWIIDLMKLKTEQQVLNLRYLLAKKPGQKSPLLKVILQLEKQSRNFENYAGQSIDSVRSGLMGTEGGISRLYFPAISPCLPKIYQFDKRSRRPAEDMFNAALNYFYGMLYSVVEGALFAAGLDPHLGILHTDEYRKPVLAFDLIEIFRPWVDRLLIDLCLDKQLERGFFTSNQHGVFLNKKGKALIIPAFNAWLREPRPFQDRENSSHRNHIYHTAGLLARRIRASEMAGPEGSDDLDLNDDLSIIPES